MKQFQYHILILLLFFVFSLKAQDNIDLFIGTYTNSCESKGVYVYNFDLKTATAYYKAASDSLINPSYLTLSDDNKTIYTVSENGDKSALLMLQYNSDNSRIELIQKQSSLGNDPCYIISDENNVILANYTGGNLVVYGKQADGNLSKAKQIIRYTASGKNTKRQEKSHLHQVQFSPDRKYVLATDLGGDLIYSYQYVPNSQKEVLVPIATTKVTSGSGPRHLTFSKDGKFVYLVQELSATVSVFQFSEGKLVELQELTLLQKNFKGDFSAADIHISPDGKFLYATNRGVANTVSTFRINENGTLKLIQTQKTGGKGPRNFTIDPTGNYLLIAHQYSNEIIIFERNIQSGLLTDSKKRIALCAPVCLVFGNQ